MVIDHLFLLMFVELQEADIESSRSETLQKPQLGSVRLLIIFAPSLEFKARITFLKQTNALME
jgi:hypothetical protein